MSRPSPDTAFRPARVRARDLSSPQLRALRKELLIVRASVERAEIAGAIVELRESVTRFSWLRVLMPRFGQSRASEHGHGLGLGLGHLLKQYPVLSSLISLLVAKPLGARVVSATRPLLKWGGVAFTAWEAWRVWQQVRRQRAESGSNGSSEATD